MNNIFKSCCLVLILAASTIANAETGNLLIQVSGLSHNRGQVIANLFREHSDVMNIKTVYRRANTIINENMAAVVFSDLEFGVYAVSIFHDENGNGELDHNMFKFPMEPLGFSNNFRFGLFTGLPSFEKLKFVFFQDSQPLDIIVR